MVPSPPRRIADLEIDILISALQRIKQNDGRLDGMDMIWFHNKLDSCQPDVAEKGEACEPDNASGNHWYPTNVQECREAMGQLKVLDDSLDILRETVAQRREHVRLLNILWAMQDGIRNIPHEILSLIFRFAYSDGGNRAFRVTETLSLVCTRFRDICLQTPQMWSSLRNDFSLSKTRLNLNRSEAVTLDISIHHYYHDGPVGRNTAQFLETVIPHSPRWVSLDIYTEDSCLVGIISELPILQLPKLARMRHVEETDEAYPNDAGQYFYYNWNMPSLTSFEGTNVMPDQTFVGSNVTECKLYWNAWEHIEEWEDRAGRKVQRIFMDDLTTSLHTLQSLQHLELDFDEVDIEMPVAPIAVLPFLKSLTLKFGYCMSVDAVDELLLSLSAPHLDTLHIMIWNDEVTRKCTKIFFRSETVDTFRNLKSFSLGTGNDDLDWYPFLRRLLRHSPLLANLTIEAPFKPLAREVDLVAHNHLQTVRFENCTMHSEPQMRAICQDLLGTFFKRMEIIKCENLSRTFLSKLEIMLEGDGVQLVWEL